MKKSIYEHRIIYIKKPPTNTILELQNYLFLLMRKTKINMKKLGKQALIGLKIKAQNQVRIACNNRKLPRNLLRIHQIKMKSNKQAEYKKKKPLLLSKVRKNAQGYQKYT